MGYGVPPSVLTIGSRVDPQANDTRRPPAIARSFHKDQLTCNFGSLFLDGRA
jgi:hypothetical protein